MAFFLEHLKHTENISFFFQKSRVRSFPTVPLPSRGLGRSASFAPPSKTISTLKLSYISRPVVSPTEKEAEQITNYPEIDYNLKKYEHVFRHITVISDTVKLCEKVVNSIL